ncbi:hypothetical protein MMR65_21010, partial [Escherichia coli]|nr:hypothetical protein [Escherichia coli]MCM4503521.1 hypothetical protein [Escherichia coli]
KGWAILLRQKQKKLIMLPSETMIWQPEFTDKTLSRKPGAVHSDPEDIPSVKAILNTLLPLEILLPVAENNKSQTINNDHPQKSCGAQPTTDEKY